MNILQNLEDYIKEFNKNSSVDFEIDTIRITFSKQHKKEHLDNLGVWRKINSKDKTILAKLKKRLSEDEVTSAYQLEKHNIYYYNSNKDKPKYRLATMVIFGLKQYHKEPPPHQIVSKIISILKDVTQIDLCFDMKQKPLLENLRRFFYLKRYFDKTIKAYTDTYYINDTNILMLDKVTIYNKAIKNSLGYPLWRIEATISIPNIKVLSLPLNEFKEVIDIARGLK